MFRQTKFYLATLTMAVLAASGASGQLQGPNPSNSPSNVSYTVNDPVTEQMTNSCNGEIVDLTGLLVYRYHQETHPNGDLHIVIDTTLNMTGTGETTHAKYTCKDSTHSDFKVDPSVNLNQQTAQHFDEHDKLKLVAQGPTPDMTTEYSVHWSIDQNGMYVYRDHPTITKCSH